MSVSSALSSLLTVGVRCSDNHCVTVWHSNDVLIHDSNSSNQSAVRIGINSAYSKRKSTCKLLPDFFMKYNSEPHSADFLDRIKISINLQQRKMQAHGKEYHKGTTFMVRTYNVLVLVCSCQIVQTSVCPDLRYDLCIIMVILTQMWFYIWFFHYCFLLHYNWSRNHPNHTNRLPQTATKVIISEFYKYITGILGMIIINLLLYLVSRPDSQGRCDRLRLS